MENIPPRILAKKVSTYITPTIGINATLNITATKDASPKEIRLIGILTNCAEITTAKLEATLFGKNLNSFLIGLDNKIIPNTTPNES